MSRHRPTRVCIVGTARRTWHPGEPAPEPLAMWTEVARAAADDVGTRADVVGAIDRLGVVHTQSWDYDDPVRRLAERLGRAGIPGTYSIVAGTSHQRLLDQAAAEMARGAASVALVVGAEAQATLRRHRAAGEAPPWSHPDPEPVPLAAMLDEWYLPTEIRHGVLPAWLTFALLAQARWAARGAGAEERRSMYEELSALSAVAEGDPEAWFPVRWTADELATPTADNRMVATPFTKRTTAFPFVDMAAANLLVTDEVADRWKVPDDRRVYLRGHGFARDATHLAARDTLAASGGMRAAATSALRAAGLELDQIDVFDVYSCFGSAVQFARDALGLAPDDSRPRSLTGGLPYYGGPGSNYMGHSVSRLVDHLRAAPGGAGLVTGIGMHMTKHVAAVWSTEPGTGVSVVDEPPQRGATPDDGPGTRTVVDAASGPVRVEAASAVHDPTGDARSAVAVCELPGGARCYATTDDPDTVAAVAAGAWVGATATVRATEGGVNRLVL